MRYKNQHIITAAYIKEWCDPKTPDGQTPYIWRVSKDGQEVDNKAPKKLFSEKNFYTVYDENGERNLDLEHYLKRIEDDFLVARRQITQHKPIADREFKSLVFFIASTFARTKFHKREQTEIWLELLEIYRRLDFQKRNPELYKQVERLQSQPMPYHILNFVNITVPVLMRMNLTVWETSGDNEFITSDNPVLWLDPSLFLKNTPISFFGLGSPLLDIIMPISPNFAVQLTWTGPEKYASIDTEPQAIDEINKLVVIFSDEFVVLSHNEPKQYWFEDDHFNI